MIALIQVIPGMTIAQTDLFGAHGPESLKWAVEMNQVSKMRHLIAGGAEIGLGLKKVTKKAG